MNILKLRLTKAIEQCAKCGEIDKFGGTAYVEPLSSPINGERASDIHCYTLMFKHITSEHTVRVSKINWDVIHSKLAKLHDWEWIIYDKDNNNIERS